MNVDRGLSAAGHDCRLTHWSSYRWCAAGRHVSTVYRACQDIDRRFSKKFVYSRTNPISYFDQEQWKFGNIGERCVQWRSEL